MRRVREIAAALLLLGLLAVGALLGGAHFAIRKLEPPLPLAAQVFAASDAATDLPVRLSYINTASQAMSRSLVLDPGLDPDPDAPYVMGFPAFVLEWADGRIFLIDLGMERASALRFGAGNEWVGADPIVPHRDVRAGLGEARERVAGVAFTHLHNDHTDGAIPLCDGLSAEIPVFQTPLQADESNYTTWPGQDRIDRAPCASLRRLEDGPLYDVPGFPGLTVLEAAGHTPGSQIFVARMAGEGPPRTWVFAGDLANHMEAVRSNLPKPSWYSLWIVPEHRERLDHLRRFLAELSREPGAALLVSHDQLHLESTAIAPW